ncbi:MAG: OmpA family protein [Limnothrix sp.]
MSKNDNPVILGFAALLTLGLMGGGLWVFNKFTPDFLNNGDGNNSLSLPTGEQESGKQNAQSTRKLEQGEVTLLGDTFSGYSTFRDTTFQQTLADAGINLTYDNEFDQAKRAAAIAQGDADLYVTTLDQFVKQQPNGKIVGLIDRTIGADAVVLNTKKYPSLKSLNDLKELQAKEPLSISYAVDTPSEYLALVLSTSFENFNLSDFEAKEVVDASEAWADLQDPNQNVAIAVLWEPFVTQAKKQGYTVVLSSKDAPTAILDVIVASDQLLEARPDLVSEFLESYYRHIDVNTRDPSKLKNQIAADGDLSTDEASAVLAGIDFFTSIEAQNWIKDGTLEKRINATAAVLTLSGELNQVPKNATNLYTDAYISEAAQNTQTLIELIDLDNPELAKRLRGEGETIAVTPTVTEKEISEAPDIGNLQVRGEVQFGSGSANLDQASQQTLQQLVGQISEFNPSTVAIRVIGHTSKTGSSQVNQQLSQQRAQVVVDALRNQGLQHNIQAEGKGFNLPLSQISPEDPRQQRTEIRLVRLD